MLTLILSWVIIIGIMFLPTLRAIVEDRWQIVLKVLGWNLVTVGSLILCSSTWGEVQPGDFIPTLTTLAATWSYVFLLCHEDE